MGRADVPKNTPKSHRRRVELLDAARRVFERCGYFDTRVADIAAEAGVSHGTFYTYFDSKDDILHTVVDGVVDRLIHAADAPAPERSTQLQALEHSIRTFMHAYRDQVAMLRVIDQATTANDTFLHLRSDIRHRFRARAEGLLAAHAIGLDPVHAAYALGGMVEDFARGAYQFGLDVDDELGIATLTTIWARAILLPAPTPHGGGGDGVGGNEARIA